MAEAELKTLADQIRGLEGALRVSDLRYKALEDREHSHVVVNSVKDRKIEKFNSKSDVDEWVQHIELYVNKKFDSELEKVNFIIDHLHDDVKIEIRLEIDPLKSTAKQLFQLLTQIYGVKKTLLELNQEFYAREQQFGESLLNYSHELMNILVLLQKKSPNKLETDHMMKQRFAEGVQDLSLRRELRRLNRESNKLIFFELRDLAIVWQKDSKQETSKLDSLTEIVTLQQQQIDTLTNVIKDQSQKVADVTEQHSYYNRGKAQYRSRSGYRGRPRGRGWNRSHSLNSDHSHSYTTNSTDDDDHVKTKSNEAKEGDEMICHYCSERNHIATYCWKRMKDRKEQRLAHRSYKSSNYIHSS
jgi:hypothetical protein